MPEEMLKIIDANKKFKSVTALDNINLSIRKNEVVGLCGQSGSGKSTLLRCVQKLENLDSGEIILNGHSAFVFQDFQLFPHFNVLRNLTYASSLLEPESDYEKKAITLLQNLGLADKALAYPQKLSGGQKQRVALARSLMLNPNILLCDEPTSGLDAESVEGVISLISELRAQVNITMLIASHDMGFITKVADRIIVMRNGKII